MSEVRDGHQEVWVFAEQRLGVLSEVSLELLSKGRELVRIRGGLVCAVLLGDGVEALAEVLHQHGADRVLLAESSHLEPYRLMPYVSIFENACRKYDPDIILFGATAIGTELAPRLAARLNTGLSAHCIDLRMSEEGEFLQVVPGWGGGVVATITCPDHRPRMATVMPGVMKKVESTSNKKELIRLEVGADLDISGPKVMEVLREKPKGATLESAEIVVAGGWGVGSPQGWKLIEELAEVLGGAVGATRPPVDEGWANEHQMIGQSGKTVRPRLYFGVGISGMSHHVVGMDESDYIVAINLDPKAAIFEYADMAVVGDYREIIPSLIANIRNKAVRSA
jgi:electron transfer flavoprotein alpha subunit